MAEEDNSASRPPDPGAPPPSDALPSRRRRLLRLVGKLLSAVLIALGSILTGVLCFALFPPSDLLRRSALPIIQQSLNHPNVHMESLTLRPLDQLEIRRFWLGPPDGYERPLFTVDRIIVHYDISRVSQGELRVKQVQVERPVINVERKKGKLNWLAFLEALPKSEPKPEDEETSSEGSDFRVWVDRVSIIGIGAKVDDGQRQVALDSLNVAIWGLISAPRTHLDVALLLESRQQQLPSLIFAQRELKQLLAGRLKTRLEVGVKLDKYPNIKKGPGPGAPNVKARIKLGLDLASQELKATRAVTPVHLSTTLDAWADTEKDRARVERFRVEFNGTELVKLNATLDGLLDQRHADLKVENLELPLNKLVSYARIFAPGVEFGGKVKVENLHLNSALKDVPAKNLPRVSGALRLSDVWADVALPGPGAKKARLDGLNLDLAFGTRPPRHPAAASRMAARTALPSLEGVPAVSGLFAAGTPSPTVVVQGRIRIGQARVQGAHLKDLELRLAAGATLKGAAAQVFASNVSLRMPFIRYVNPGLGPVQLSLDTDLEASGDLTKKLMVLDRLRVHLPGLLTLGATARAEDMGNRALTAQVIVPPVRLASLLARVPPRIRSKLRGLRLGGAVGLKTTLTGRRPSPAMLGDINRNLFKLPLRVDTRITLKDVSVRDARRKLSLAGLTGELTTVGRPSDLRLGSRISIAQLSKPDQHLEIKGLGLSHELHLRPRQVTFKARMKIKEVKKTDQGVIARGQRSSLDVSAAVPLGPLLAGRLPAPGKLALELKTGFSAVKLSSPGNKIAVDALDSKITFAYDRARGKKGVLTHATTVGMLTHAQQKAKVKGLRLGARLSTPLDLPRLMTNKPHALGAIAGRVDLGLDSVTLAAPGNSLQVNALSTGVDLSYDPRAAAAASVKLSTKLGTLRHAQQKLRLKGLGLEVGVKIAGPVLKLPAPDLKMKNIDTQLQMTLKLMNKKGLGTLKNNRIDLVAAVSDALALDLRHLAVRSPSLGLHLDLSGKTGSLASYDPKKLPTFDLTLDSGLKTPMTNRLARARRLLPGLKVSGAAGVKLRVRHRGGNRVQIDTRLLARSFNMWRRTVGMEPRKPSGYLRTISLLHLKNLTADLPISQTITLALPRYRIPPPKQSIFGRKSSSVLYKELRPYSGRRAKLSIGGVTIEDKIAALSREGHLISTARRKNTINKLSMDLSIADSSFLLNRLYLKLFSGDVAGSLRLQILDFERMARLNATKLPDMRLHLKTQITGVNLSYLDPEVTVHTPNTEVSALVDLKYEACKEFVEGRINITQLSLDMLDSLLAYIDPNKVNKSVQKNRKMLKAWYIKVVNPQVKLVSIWISHGNLNMDIEIDAMEPIGAIIRRILKNNRIRRISIRRWLPRCAATPVEESGT